MKIVVTGALGHIGSRLIRALPAAFPGAAVVMVDDLSTQRYASLFDLPRDGKYTFHEADVLKADLPRFFEGADAVIHLAAITTAAASFGIKDRIEEVNYEATVKVADACAKTGSPLLFLSTTSVYSTAKADIDEDCAASELVPQSPYADAKLKAERYLAGAEHDLRFLICRFGTIFGTSPGMRFHTAVNKFCWQAVMGQPVTVWKTALNQVRSYLDLDDAIRALVFLLESRRFDNHTYNVLTLNTTVADILEVIKGRVPGLTVNFVEEKIMNSLSYRVSRAKFEALGFSFQGDLRKAVFETIDLLGEKRA